jgi:hypothetical protein
MAPIAQSDDDSDRRKYPRIRTEQLISFAFVESENRLAVSKNLSKGGICFEVMGCEIALGDMLRLTFNLQDDTVVAVGRVVWATDIDAFTQEVGLEFLDIDPFALETLERGGSS